MKKFMFFALVPGIVLGSLLSPLTVSSSSAIITIPPSAFQPTHNCDFHNGGDAIYPEGGNPCRGFHAPVYLSQGVTVTKLTFYWRDLSASDNVVCGFFRENHYGAVYVGYGQGYSQGSDLYYSSTTIDLNEAFIDYSSGGYLIYAEIPANTMLFSVQLEYTYNTLLPSIFR